MTDGHRCLSRRAVTLLLGGATLSPIASLASGAAEIQTTQSSVIKNTLLSLFEDPHRMNSLGSVCLGEVSFSETSWSKLEALLLSIGSHDFDGETRILIKSKINDLICKDFRDDDVVFINGWVLSITEALLYAFVARHFQPQPHHVADLSASDGAKGNLVLPI